MHSVSNPAHLHTVIHALQTKQPQIDFEKQQVEPRLEAEEEKVSRRTHARILDTPSHEHKHTRAWIQLNQGVSPDCIRMREPSILCSYAYPLYPYIHFTHTHAHATSTQTCTRTERHAYTHVHICMYIYTFTHTPPHSVC